MPFKQRIKLLATLLVSCALLPASSFAQLSFQPSQHALTSNSPTVVFHGDFNNDGREDLIVTGNETNGTYIDQLYLSNGNGSYQTPITLSALALAIGDFNDDGNLDFAAIGSTGNVLAVYLGNGDGTFKAPKTTTGFGESTTTILLPVDLNHDNKTDLVVVSPGDGNSTPATLQLFTSNGDGTFAKGQTIVAGTGTLAHQGATSTVTGDFDGDGKPDVALLYGFIYDSSTKDDITQPTTVQVFYGDGAGHLGSPSVTADPNKYGHLATIAADVNNDGRSDIVTVATNPANGESQFFPVLSIFTGNSNRTLSYSKLVTNQCAGIGAGSLTIADFNGDGLNDIAYQESPCNQSSNVTDVAIRLGKGADSFAAEQVVYQNLYQTGPPFAVRSTLGTKPDIVFSEYLNSGPSGAIELLTNTSTGAFPGCGPTGFAEGVQVCTPGATAASPVQFSVGAAGPTPMRTAAVWADGKKVAEQLTHAFSSYSFLDASIPLAAGKHAVTVYGTGWDDTLQKKSFTLIVGSGACSAPTTAGVHVCQPASGSSVSSPVTIQATSTTAGKFDRMEVWVDGVKKYTETSGTTLNTTLSVAAGTHRFGIFAVNTAGTKWEGAVDATVK